MGRQDYVILLYIFRSLNFQLQINNSERFGSGRCGGLVWSSSSPTLPLHHNHYPQEHIANIVVDPMVFHVYEVMFDITGIRLTVDLRSG
jgi:hypothetical protein